MFEASALYLANLNSTADLVVNQGGTYSGKTYAIDQTLFSLAISEANQVITVAACTVPILKTGAYRDAQTIIRDSPELNALIKSHHKTDRIIEFNSGSIIEFRSFPTPEDAKGGKRDYLFFNEVDSIPFDTFWQARRRTRKRTFIDYNPTAGFWCHDKILSGENNSEFSHQLIISDHRHNTFLTQKEHDSIENISDKELWKVYARGLTGKIEGLIFRNWHTCETIPKDAKLIAVGMDFGFTNDPTAIVEVYQQDGELWLNELVYERGLTNQAICAKLRDLGIKEQTIIADSAEPKSIHEIYLEGFNIYGAEKGADSIKNSIDVLKRYKINVTNSSINLRKELNTYKWATDKDGNTINKPIDFANHLIDALRYVALNKLSVRNEGSYSISVL